MSSIYHITALAITSHSARAHAHTQTHTDTHTHTHTRSNIYAHISTTRYSPLLMSWKKLLDKAIIYLISKGTYAIMSSSFVLISQ